jgi:hypothetical protein
MASRERMSHFLLSEGERNAKERRNRSTRSGKTSASKKERKRREA